MIGLLVIISNEPSSVVPPQSTVSSRLRSMLNPGNRDEVGNGVLRKERAVTRTAFFEHMQTRLDATTSSFGPDTLPREEVYKQRLERIDDFIDFITDAILLIPMTSVLIYYIYFAMQHLFSPHTMEKIVASLLLVTTLCFAYACDDFKHRRTEVAFLFTVTSIINVFLVTLLKGATP